MDDLQKKLSQIADLKKIIRKETPRIVAKSALKMTDANFSAQGFVRNGSASPKWAKRAKDTPRSRGKRILHSTGTMQSSVKSEISGMRISVGVDTGLVPYAKMHNDGGRVIQNIRALFTIYQRYNFR